MSSLFVNNTKQRLRIYIFILLSLLSVLLYTFICVYTLENGLTLVNIHIERSLGTALLRHVH